MQEYRTKGTGPVLSVIIPVYNVEPYLSTCMESLLSFRSNEIEYICVAGKSKDRSTDILHRYAEKDRRVTVIEQQDTGLSEARNLGAGVAMGEYLLFADSDDFVRPSLFEQLFMTIKKDPQSDVFVTDFSMIILCKGKILERKIFQNGTENDGARGLDYLPKMLKKRQCFWNVWRYVYRRSFLESHGITFREGSMCEDLDFTNHVLMSEPKILFLHCPFYCYRVAREDSLMGHTTDQRVRDTASVLKDNIQTLACSDFKWKQELIAQYQFELILSMAQIYEIPHEERATVKDLLQKCLPALNVGDDKIAKSAYWICSVVGIKTMAFCLAVAKKIKHKRRRAWKPIEEPICL